MPTTWTAPTVTMITEEFTPAEINIIGQHQGSESLPGILGRVVDKCQGAILAGGYVSQADLTANAGLLPPELHGECIAMARWNLLIAFPALKALQSEPRKEANDAALKKLEAIAAQKCSVRPPTATTGASRTGNWNSENKLIGRTHPTPRPAAQFPPNADDYGNPDAPADSAAT